MDNKDNPGDKRHENIYFFKVLYTVNGKYTVFTAENTTTGKVSRDGILPELPSYRLPGRFSVRPALRTQGEKGNGYGPQLNSFLKCSIFR